MFRFKQITVIILALGWLLIPVLPAESCSLALHDWQPLFNVRIPVSAPFLPLAELDAICDRIPKNSIEKVIWVANHTFLSRFSLAFLELIPNQEARLPWQAVLPQASVLEMARKGSDKAKTPLIIGSDQNQLQIVLFVDHNADNHCFQLVLLQTSRIRAVYANPQNPWAQESRGLSWLSVVFYQMPLPGRILSLAIFPIYQTRNALIDNHELAEQLLKENRLLRRPEQVFDPYTFDFPDIPE